MFSEGSGSAAVTIHLTGLELPAALPRLTSPLAKRHYQVPPMWFHLDRQGLQLQSADSLSGHRAGAVRGRPHWMDMQLKLNNPHHGTHTSLQQLVPRGLFGAGLPRVKVSLHTDHYWASLLTWDDKISKRSGCYYLF